MSDYGAFAAALGASGVITDPFVGGAPRFRPEPVVLSRERHVALCEAAEAVAAAYDELCRMVHAEPALLDGFFGLTPLQRVMWHLSAPLWHGIARADMFFTDSGPMACELNCDTPSGVPEAVLLGEAARRERPGLEDPNAALGERFRALVGTLGRTLRREGPLSIGIVYPTELTEDLALVRLYRDWLTAAGHRVTLGSPFNLVATPSGVALLGAPCDLLVRHYKTDWWGERQPIWTDEAPYPDPDPLERPLGALAAALLAGRVVVVNPFAAVLPQNKRAMAFMWEALPRFSTAAQAAIRAHVPFTARLETMDRETLRRERADWVLKSDYGCEGDEVLLGATCSDESWAEALEKALPRRFVVQRRFLPRLDGEGLVANHGVYLVAGQAAGVYTRLSSGPTDGSALSVATLVQR